MSLTVPTGPYFTAADAEGRDIHASHVVYEPGRGAPDGRAERRAFAGYVSVADALQAAGAHGQVFEVRGRVVGHDSGDRPLFESVTVLARVTD